MIISHHSPSTAPNDRPKTNEFQIATDVAEAWLKIEAALKVADKTERQSRAFAFARAAMRYFPREWEPDHAADFFEQICDDYYRGVIEHMCSRIALTRPFLTAGFWINYLGASREEFLAAWCGVLYAPDEDPIGVARADALAFPLKPAAKMTAKYVELLSLAGHLQRRLGDKDIALPQERISARLAISQQAVSLYLGRLERDGFIRKTKGFDRAAKKASMYRFDMMRFDWSSGREVAMSACTRC